MPKCWRIRPHDPARIAELQRAAGVSAVVAQLLAARGTTDAEGVRIFLDPRLSALRDPELLPGCAQAAAHLWQAVKDHKRIIVYGDYDVDGMTGLAILVRCLRLLGGNVGWYVPNRIEEGYGLNCEALRGLAADGAQVLLTVDCGIASLQEARYARTLGLEMIITDHHEPGPVLPDARAIVHPRLPAERYPFGGLSGSGVALKLAWALCRQAAGARRVGERLRDFLIEAVGLAALGTVADVVPLIDENRVLVRHGLNGILVQPTVGLAALLKVSALAAKKQLKSDDMAFELAPRLNAAGRLGQPQLAVELLITDREERATELAQSIDNLNRSRQKLERSILLAASKQIKEQFDLAVEPALVLAERGWHPGVIGIVAGRLASKHHRPVVMVSWDQMGTRSGIGSARSVPGVNLYAALTACSEFLLAHGGHAAAAGLRIAEEQLAGFRAAFCEVVAASLGGCPGKGELWIDAEVPLAALTLDTVRQIDQLAPFGEGNPHPVLCTSGVTLAGPPRLMGENGQHLALRLVQHGVAMRAVAFSNGEWCEDLATVSEPIDVAFYPVINHYRGRQSVELRLVDWRRGFGTSSTLSSSR